MAGWLTRRCRRWQRARSWCSLARRRGERHKPSPRHATPCPHTVMVAAPPRHALVSCPAWQCPPRHDAMCTPHDDSSSRPHDAGVTWCWYMTHDIHSHPHSCRPPPAGALPNIWSAWPTAHTSAARSYYRAPPAALSRASACHTPPLVQRCAHAFGHVIACFLVAGAERTRTSRGWLTARPGTRCAARPSTPTCSSSAPRTRSRRLARGGARPRVWGGVGMGVAAPLPPRSCWTSWRPPLPRRRGDGVELFHEATKSFATFAVRVITSWYRHAGGLMDRMINTQNKTILKVFLIL